MALVMGTNCGFVTVAPTSDPLGNTQVIDSYSYGLKDTTAGGVTKITEIGWWCDTATEASNYEVAIYSHDSGNNRPLNAVHVDATNAKGTTSGWKTVTVDWAVSASTTYWICIQLDDTATQTDLNVGAEAGNKYVYTGAGQTTLPDPWGATNSSDNYIIGVYAKTSSGGGFEGVECDGM